MKLNIAKEVATLECVTVGELHERYAEVFGETARSRHKQYLIRRIAWRLQANAEGGLSERALRRAEELANLADVRVTPPTDVAGQQSDMSDRARPRVASDPRLPSPGTQITRKYKGQTIVVTVLPDGFEYEADRYADDALCNLHAQEQRRGAAAGFQLPGRTT